MARRNRRQRNRKSRQILHYYCTTAWVKTVGEFSLTFENFGVTNQRVCRPLSLEVEYASAQPSGQVFSYILYEIGGNQDGKRGEASNRSHPKLISVFPRRTTLRATPQSDWGFISGSDYVCTVTLTQGQKAALDNFVTYYLFKLTMEFKDTQSARLPVEAHQTHFFEEE